MQFLVQDNGQRLALIRGMRLCLFWNDNAGDGTSVDELSRLITREGHEIVSIVEKREALPRSRDLGVDCVVAAGGDGTVARAGRALAGGDVPLAILPIGTANNIACSLFVDSNPERAIRAWKLQRMYRIDVGVVRDEQGESLFLESVGTGLVADQIAGSVGVVKSDDPVESQLSQARRLYLEGLQRQPVRRSSIKLDGDTVAGDYLLIEVLNIAAIGPGVRLSGDVSPADGLLSVVAAGNAERPAIKDYMRERVKGEPDHAGLPSWRASRVELNGLHEYHVDDEARSANGKTVSIAIKPGYLAVLG